MERGTLTIVHFNDVYNIGEREKEPVGGAARFKTCLDCLYELHPLVLFSGDALSPSSISIVTEGRHMVPILNSFGVKAAVYGNHEFGRFHTNITLHLTLVELPQTSCRLWHRTPGVHCKGDCLPLVAEQCSRV